MTAPGALKITAGPSYPGPGSPPAQVVPVNSPEALRFSSPIADTRVSVSIANFKGSQEHMKNSFHDSKRADKLSVIIQLRPKQDIPGHRLLFGNDFGYPIKSFLPYGTTAGLRIFKYMVDPSVDGDLYADRPWLYGRALSSFNLVNVSETDNFPDLAADSLGLEENTDLLSNAAPDKPIPPEGPQRKAHFTNLENLKNVVLKKDLYYLFAFHTDILSLEDNNFKIALPGGFQLDLQNYLGNKLKGTDSSVRWVLKLADDDEQSAENKLGVDTGTPILVITFQVVEE